MIQRVKAEGLFGLYDYDILFSQSPSVKILTGPNGYGKTTLLLAIDNLFKGNFWFFHFLDFKKIAIYLIDSNKLTSNTLLEQTIVIDKHLIEQHQAVGQDNTADDTDANIFEETIQLLDGNNSCIEELVIKEDYIEELVSICKKKSSYGEPFRSNNEELLSRLYDVEDDLLIQTQSRNISLALQEYDTIYLPAQRMISREHRLSRIRSFSRNNYSYEIDRVNYEISLLYREAQNMFAAASQRIDATFISRLLKVGVEYTKEQLKNRLDELKKRIDGYKRLNLINDMELLDYSLDDKSSPSGFNKVLSLYVDDMNEKMNRFENLYNKISLYKQILSKMVLSEKTVDFSDDGLTIKNTTGQLLSNLHKLSSGEQNLLILYYNLLFKTNGKTILLIDEPENSLHVAWQSKMLDDYISMSKMTGCQILFATHSPTFINGRWDLTTDLFRQHKGLEQIQ